MTCLVRRWPFFITPGTDYFQGMGVISPVVGRFLHRTNVSIVSEKMVCNKKNISKKRANTFVYLKLSLPLQSLLRTDAF